MQFFETLLYFVVTLGVLVFVHELGHFLAAKLCGMRVDRFSIGFPPRAFGKRIGETDYCISWIPIGGYVKIAGMIDESFDTEHIDKPPEAWEFRAKPIWQKMFVLSAGVIMNILLAILIFWGINYAQGKAIWETTDIGYVVEESPAARAGVQAGDRVLRVNGKPVTDWETLTGKLYLESLSGQVALDISRNGEELTLTLPQSETPETAPTTFGIIPAHTEITVRTVETGLPADKLGLQPGDALITLNGTAVRYDSSVINMVKAHAGMPLNVEWKRAGKLMSGTTVPTDDGKIGISFGFHYVGPRRIITYSLLEAFPQSLHDIFRISGLFAQQIGHILTGKTPLSQSVGGPIRIAQMATQTAELGLLTYLSFMALLSVSLAILNILPVPALDGGHLLLLAIEGIIRREIPVRVKLGIQKAGFFLLLAFMAFVVYNDIIHF